MQPIISIKDAGASGGKDALSFEEIRNLVDIWILIIPEQVQPRIQYLPISYFYKLYVYL